MALLILLTDSMSDLTTKNFDFSLVAYGAAGNQIVQSYRNHANSKANYTTAS